MTIPSRKSLPERLSDPGVLAFGVAVVSFLAFYLLWLIAKPGGEANLTYLSNIVYHVPLLVAVVSLSLATLRSSGVARAGWALAALGTASLAAGELVWTLYDAILHLEVPLPSVADALYYPGDILLIIAFALLVMPASNGKGTWRSLVDGGLVAVALATLSWHFVLRPAAQMEDMSTVAVASTLGYPLMDLTMIVVLIAATYRRAESPVPIPVFLLGLGTLFIAVSDTLYVHLATVQGYDPTGNPVEFGWVAGYAIFAAAGFMQWRYGDSVEASIRIPGSHSAVSFAVPYLITVPVLVLLIGTTIAGDGDPMIAAAVAILVVGIAVRQWITILELRDRERLISHMAYHDSLTGLPNRALLLDRAEQAIPFARRQGTGLAVLSIDLDKFKQVNDTYGHLFGDRFLRSVANALSTALRETDTVARVGGDEFVVLLPGVDSAGVASVMADKLLEALRTMEVDGNPFAAHASIGITLCPRDGATLEELWNRADAAMYEAKEGGRDRLQVYSPSPVAVPAG
jgi:diguanylate cyclase (GGDEF)-like protein